MFPVANLATWTMPVANGQYCARTQIEHTNEELIATELVRKRNAQM